MLQTINIIMNIIKILINLTILIFQIIRNRCYFPLMKFPIRFAFALVFALSIGDLGIIVLFSGSESSTLPMYLYRLMGSYRMDEAYAVALLLLILALSSFWIIEKGFYYATLRKKMLN